MFRDILPVRASYPRKFDILVVDEAHNVAPAGSAHYALESQRTQFIRKIAPHFQHRLFLTATPHNGYTESFTSLLELLDDQRFSRNILPDDKQLSQVMIRRLKTDLVDKDGKPIYPKRNLQALPCPSLPTSVRYTRLLDAYCKSREKTCQNAGATGTKFVNGLLKKRFFSSPAAFASTLEKHFSTLTSGKVQRKPDAMTDRILRKAILKAEEDYADDGQVEAAQTEAVEEATKRSVPPTDEELRLLSRLRGWAQSASHKVDSKGRAILEWIESEPEIRAANGTIAASFFSPSTARHISGFIRFSLHTDMAETVLRSFMAAWIRKSGRRSKPHSRRTRRMPMFASCSPPMPRPKASICRTICNCLIHIEIPYNPNVMEQRNGRIDRHGQKYGEVLIWHPVDGGAATGETLGGHKDDIIRALTKLEAMREDMGSVNPVIAPQMAGSDRGHQTRTGYPRGRG